MQRSEGVRIYNTDILTFKHYKKYDVIYYYCPIKARTLETLFEEILEDAVDVGAIIIPCLKQSTVICNDRRFKRITIVFEGNCNNPVVFYQKISNEKRRHSELSTGLINLIPEKYHKLFKKHMKKLNK